MKNRDKIFIVLKFVVTIGSLSWILRSIDVTSVLQIIQDSDFKYLLFALIPMLFQVIIAAIRWKKVLKNLSHSHSFARVLYCLWIGLFFSQTLPSSIGGDVVRGYYICKEGCSLKSSTLSVLLDRIFGMTGLLVLVVITTPLFFNRINDETAKLGLIIISIISVGSILSIFVFNFPKKISHWKVVRMLFVLMQEAKKIMFSSLSGAKLIVLSVVVHTISIISVVILSLGAGLNISWIDIMLIVPLATLFMTIPISIAGWGVREGVMVLGLGYLGVSSESALTLAILFGLLPLIISLPGIVFWIFNRFRHVS